MSKRAEFSAKTKQAAFNRAKGMCECGCGLPLVGTPQYHHISEEYLTHDNSLENCCCCNYKCHQIITRRNRPAIDKTRRIIKDLAGIKPTRPSFSTNRNGRFKRKMDGTIVER